MGCQKLTYYDSTERALEKKLFFEKGALEKRYAEEKNRIDYYPFGMSMKERSFSSPDYRYGFNGMEKDEEMKGDGNSYDFGARIYDPRLGRWLAVDPLSGKYPNLSPYNFVANNPTVYIDPDGERIKWWASKGIWRVRAALRKTDAGKEIWKALRKDKAWHKIVVSHAVVLDGSEGEGYVLRPGIWLHTNFEPNNGSYDPINSTIVISIGIYTLQQNTKAQFSEAAWSKMSEEYKLLALEHELLSGLYKIKSPGEAEYWFTLGVLGFAKNAPKPITLSLNLTLKASDDGEETKQLEKPKINETLMDFIGHNSAHEATHAHSANEIGVEPGSLNYKKDAKTKKKTGSATELFRDKSEDRAYKAQNKVIEEQKSK